MKRAIAVAALAIAFAGCGGKSAPTGALRTSADLITREEIMKQPVENVYDAVQRLRPGFLRARSTATRTTAYPVVFVDGIRRGDPETLRTIPTRGVDEIRYIKALDATTRYGLNIEGGVIEVKMLSQ
jgi:hypothetical protein